MKVLQESRGILFLFPSLITELCTRSEVKEYAVDTWVHPSPRIFPLNMQGDCAPSQSKNRKVDFGNSIAEDLDSCRPSTTGPLEDIDVDIKAIKELVSGFP